LHAGIIPHFKPTKREPGYAVTQNPEGASAPSDSHYALLFISASSVSARIMCDSIRYLRLCFIISLGIALGTNARHFQLAGEGDARRRRRIRAQKFVSSCATPRFFWAMTWHTLNNLVDIHLFMESLSWYRPVATLIFFAR
jgi:hypothetical protein